MHADTDLKFQANRQFFSNMCAYDMAAAGFSETETARQLLTARPLFYRLVQCPYICTCYWDPPSLHA